jgi:vacuolar protein sorting-associated protein 13A/C
VTPVNSYYQLTLLLGFNPSDFAIISTDGHSDFDIENRLTLRDHHNKKLDLKLNYM